MLNIKEMLAGSIRRLSHVNRYSSVPVQRRESVADHTCHVCLYALLIGKSIQADSGISVDFGQLLTTGLVHDLDEALTGDFLRTVKYETPGLRDALNGASVRVIQKMEKDLNVSGLLGDWEDAKDDTIEGQILALADLLSVASYIIEETYSGNRHIIGIYPELIDYLDKLLNDSEQLHPRLFTYVVQTTQYLNDIYEEAVAGKSLIPPPVRYKDV